MKLNFWKKKKSKNQNLEFDLSTLSESDIQMIKRFGKPNNVVAGYTSKAFVELPFGMIKKQIPNLIKSEKILEVVELVMKHQFPDFKIEQASGNEVICFMLWINQWFERIQKIEKLHLSSEPEPELLASGLMKLDEFGVEPLLEKIAKDWNYQKKEVENFPYHEIYMKQKLDKVNRDIEKKYNKILEDKAKRKK